MKNPLSSTSRSLFVLMISISLNNFSFRMSKWQVIKSFKSSFSPSGLLNFSRIISKQDYYILKISLNFIEVFLILLSISPLIVL